MPEQSHDRRWYEEWFDRDEYEIVYRHRDEEEARKVIDLVESVARPNKGDRIVDVGCGRGRHAVALGRRGYRVTGVDLSERAVLAARDKAESEGVNVDFKVGDMREAVCHACFDGAVNLFTAFGYFERDEEHQAALSAVAEGLVPRGWFFQDFMNASYVRANLVPFDVDRVDGIVIEQHRRLEKGRIRKDIVLRSDGDEHRFSESVQLFTMDDFRRLYDKAGLEIKDRFGDYDGGPLTNDSPRMILFSRKRR